MTIHIRKSVGLSIVISFILGLIVEPIDYIFSAYLVCCCRRDKVKLDHDAKFKRLRSA